MCRMLGALWLLAGWVGAVAPFPKVGALSDMKRIRALVQAGIVVAVALGAAVSLGAVVRVFIWAAGL